MKTIDIHRYNMLVRVREFGAGHRDLFPAAATGGRAFADLSKAVDELSAQATAEVSGQGSTRERAKCKTAARDALRQAVDTIVRTARALAVDTPALDGKFRLPSRRNDHQLATAARTFARDAAPLKAQFLAHGLTKTFLADLQGALDAFERATQDHFAARETQVAARAGIATALDAALLALTRLDAIVPNVLRDKPTMMAAWTSARRVTRPRTGGDRAPVPPAAAPEVTVPAGAPNANRPEAGVPA